MTDLEYWRDLGLRLQAAKSFRWALPWCTLPDKWGRVYRRNWCPDDAGMGWEQVAGKRRRSPRGDSVIDLRDPGSMGCLLALVREAWKDPGIGVACDYSYDRGYRWRILAGHPHGSTFTRAASLAYNSEAEALIALLEAAP